MADLSTVLLRAMDTVRAGIRTSGIATVTDYDHETQTVTATPMLREERLIDGVRVTVEPVPIEGVPVFWPCTSERGLTMGLDDGDQVLLVVRTQSHDEIDAGDDGPLTPALARRMDLADVIAIPGFTAPASSGGLGRSDGAPTLAMKSGDVFHVGSSTADKALALAESVDARLSDLHAWMSFGGSFFTWATGIINSVGSAAPGVAPPATPPVSAGPFATVDCDDVKVRS